MLQPGQSIDRYTVESVIGHGGTAVVYLVRHNQLGSQHALKVLSLASGAIRQRLLREGQVQAALQHVNIVTVTDVLDVGGNPGLLMEHIDGPALDQAMRRYRISLRDGLTLFRGIVAGVRAAHRKGLVHRDLKPANVLLFQSPEGFVPKVTDFGLAKVISGRGAQIGQTRQGIAMGTPAYMAPEQIRDAAAVDQRADLFSLGCLLYELATHARAFPGEQALEIYNNIVAGRYTPPEELAPDLPDAVINAIDGCLIVERERRIPDCDTLLRVLAGKEVWAVEHHPVPDEVLPTEEVPRDAPEIPLAQRKPTPGTAPPRTSLPAPSDPSDPLLSGDGTLGGETSIVPPDAPRHRGRTLAIGAAVLGLLLVIVAVIGVVGLGTGAWLWRGQGGTEGPALSTAVDDRPDLDGTTGAPFQSPEASTADRTGDDPPPETVPGDTPSEASGAEAGGQADVEPPVEGPSPSTDPASGSDVNDDPPQPDPMAAVPTTGEVRFFSDPRTVELFIDDRDRGRTPKKLELPFGTHQVRVRSGDREAVFPIDVGPDGVDTWCYSFDRDRASPGKCR